MFDLNGKKALITGATQGIGFATAKCLSEHGAKVFVNGATSMEKCEAACMQIKNSAPALANLIDKNCAETLFGITGGVDILVLCASIQYKRDWDCYSDEEYENQMLCNLRSSYLLIKKYAPYMKEQHWGRIVTVGSVNQYNNHPQLSLYGVTKAAQMKLTENIAPALAPYGVTVNNVAPGAVNTPRNSTALSDSDFRKKVENSIPAAYVGEPEDIAPAILLMCSDEGRYITGTDLIIDGGMHL